MRRVNELLYEEYRPSHRRFGIHPPRTALLGLVPAATAALLIASRGPAAGPGLWSALGISLAAWLALWSAREGLRTREPMTRTGRRLARQADLWFPSFLIAVQGVFVAVTVLLLWLTICDLGLRSSPVQHAAIAAILLVVPAGRILAATRPPEPSPARQNAEEFIRLSLVWLGCILAAMSVTVIQAPRQGTPRIPVAVIAAWIPASLAMIVSLVLYIDRVSARRSPLPGEERRDRLD
jgi:hypothetical protein